MYSFPRAVLHTQSSLVELGYGAGYEKAAVTTALQRLYEQMYITYPLTDIPFLPASVREDAPKVFAAVKALGAVPNDPRRRVSPTSPVFLAGEFPHAHHGIQPCAFRSEAHPLPSLSELSLLEELLYCEIAMTYVQAVCTAANPELDYVAVWNEKASSSSTEQRIARRNAEASLPAPHSVPVATNRPAPVHMACPYCEAPLDGDPDDIYPKLPDPKWSTDGDCLNCAAELRFEFDANGARVIRQIGWSK